MRPSARAVVADVAAFHRAGTALIAGKIDRYNATERLALWRSSKHAAAVFNFEPTQLPASFPALDRWVKGMVDQVRACVRAFSLYLLTLPRTLPCHFTSSVFSLDLLTLPSY